MTALDLRYLREHLPHRPDNAHKGTMGTLCSITGSYGFSGAAVLSAKAALRSGVGLLFQIIPEAIYAVYAASCTQIEELLVIVALYGIDILLLYFSIKAPVFRVFKALSVRPAHAEASLRQYIRDHRPPVHRWQSG